MTEQANAQATAHASRMPALFVGHGSPMNAIENNRFTAGWVEMGKRLARLPERPRAIVAVSAHWMSERPSVRTELAERQVNDMYGFPQALYDISYAPDGDPALARRIIDASDGALVADNGWGLDHGLWTPLYRLFPEGDVPVVPVSVAPRLSAERHFEIGRLLRPLRDEGVLVMGSGNVVHSFKYASPAHADSLLPWAEQVDAEVRDAVVGHDWSRVANYREFGKDIRKAFQTTEHYLPLPAVLGAAWEDEPVEVWNEGGQLGSFSMTSYAFGMPEA